MISNAAERKAARTAERKAQRTRVKAEHLKKGEPLEVELSVSFKFGEQPDDLITPIRERKVPMVDSVFKNRDRIMRQFAALLFKTGMSSPKVVGRVLPVPSPLRRSNKK
ncbi:MAG: hypothetical protein M3O62_06890 [Pseudomonadota bacterium]|nr:hypothetical protein [Pseudomonadota bacterium]